MKELKKLSGAILFLMLALLPEPLCSSTACNDCNTPPFIAEAIPPNVLIILDNSNSMDESFYGEAVGSYSPAGKSVAAREAIQTIIDQLKDKVRVGLITYRLPGTVNSWQIHNSPYFASYEDKSYCPDPPKACEDYCLTGDATYLAQCESGCKESNSSFDGSYFDAILTNPNYPVGSDTWKRYCALVYPKTERMVNLTDQSKYVYYKHAYPFYSSGNQGNAFCYSPDPPDSKKYNANENTPWDYYFCYRNKTGDSDGHSGYSNQISPSYWQLEPSDSDFALGYMDFGKRLNWVHVGPAWFANSSPGSGYIHVKVGALTNADGSETDTYRDLKSRLDPKKDMGVPATGADYMSCTKSNKNECAYIVNAGLTPTAGTLDTVINYFNSTTESPIDVTCRKNFVIYVTDGLPSVDTSGRTVDPSTDKNYSADRLMTMPGGVLAKLDTLRNITKEFAPDPSKPKKTKTYKFDVKTYVLGVGLSADSRRHLDSMAVRGGTAPAGGHAFYADDAEELARNMSKIFADILGRTASGTSISILSEKAQMGANMMQAVFYPSKTFASPDASSDLEWIGYLYDYWFYVSKTKSNIREDTVHDYTLKLKEDYGLTFDFDEASGLQILLKQDLDGDGEPETDVKKVGLDELKPIWEAGDILFRTTPESRKIYTAGSNGELINFDEANMAASTLLGSPTANFPSCLAGADDSATRTNLINYLRGDDDPTPECRNRTATIGGVTDTWKLGDIIYSTPKVESDYRFCSNGVSFVEPATICTTDAECGAGRSCVKKESVVFVGANDGMLHAFKTGVLSVSGLNANQGEIAKLEGIPQADMGKELWAFIPKNTLPYLRCLADPNYCHLSYVDLTPYITEMVSTVEGVQTIKKVLIGGMRLGGASCTNSGGSNYNCDAPLDTCSDVACADLNTCFNPSNCTGLSSYYALDITNPEDPKLLWEFSHPRLGYSYSGPAVITREETLPLGGTRRRNFVMFLSGPLSRDGDSNQELHVFVLSLNDQLGIESLYVKKPASSLNQTFGGRLFTNGLDVNEDGNTDFVFFGLSTKTGGVWQGGIAKIWTGGVNPANWHYDAGNFFNTSQVPMTAKVEFGKCFDKWFIFAGSGRFFYKNDTYAPNSADFIMGSQFLCDANNNCGQGSMNWSHGGDAACDDLQKSRRAGWYWELERPAEATGYLKERSITDPTITDKNMVFFTTTEPTSNVCGYGGRSRVWGFNCATGGAISDSSCAGYKVQGVGTIFLQTSTGSINKIDPAKSFEAGSPSSEWFSGIPPESAPPFVPPSEMKNGKILHWIER